MMYRCVSKTKTFVAVIGPRGRKQPPIENNRETAVFLLKIFSNLHHNLKSY